MQGMVFERFYFVDSPQPPSSPFVKGEFKRQNTSEAERLRMSVRLSGFAEEKKYYVLRRIANKG